LRGVPIRVSLDNTDGKDTVQALMRPEDVVVTDNALVTFTTGSTGMPKLLLRKHNFVLNQSKALSIAFKEVMPSKEERDSTFLTNLNVFGLHFLVVSVYWASVCVCTCMLCMCVCVCVCVHVLSSIAK